MNSWRESAVDAWLLAFPPTMLTFSLPLSVYARNQSDLGPSVFPALMLLCCLSVFALLTVSTRRVSLPPRLIYAMAAVGFFVAINSMLTPVRMTTQPDEAIQIAASPQISELVGEAFLILSLATAVFLLKPGQKHWVAALAFTLLTSFAVPALASLSWMRDGPAGNAPAQHSNGTRANIYHVTWDGYSSEVFLQNLRTLGVADEFTDFVFFADTRSNYAATPLSHASFMTGMFLRTGRINPWITTEWRDADITTYARRAGYAISSYTEGSSYYQPNETALARSDSSYKSKSLVPAAVFLFDISFLRAVPSIFRPVVLVDGKGPFARSKLGDSALYESAPHRYKLMYEDLLTDELIRPKHNQYVYAHLMIPHWPHVLNGDCDVDTKADYYTQSLCATRMMANLLRRLKDSGKYDASTIVFHSDHGQWGVTGENTVESEYKKFAFDLKTRALLAIKPPNDAGAAPLKVELQAAQLLDIPATIAALSGFKFSSDQEGASLFPKRPVLDRIDSFVGFYKHRKELEAGKAAAFTHYVYHPATRTWTRESSVKLRL